MSNSIAPTTAIREALKSENKWYQCSYLHIKMWNNDALKRGFNRVITESVMKKLDRHGVNMIQCVMPMHTNFEGKNSIRASLLVKYQKYDEPRELVLDIDHQSWANFLNNNEPISFT